MGPTTYLQTLGNSFQVQGGLLPKPPRHHHFPPLLHQKRKRLAARLAVVGDSLPPQEPIHSQPGAALAVTGSPGQTQRKGLIPASRPRHAPDTPKPVPGLIENVLSQVLAWACLGPGSSRWLRHGLSTQTAPRKGPEEDSKGKRVSWNRTVWTPTRYVNTGASLVVPFALKKACLRFGTTTANTCRSM